MKSPQDHRDELIQGLDTGVRPPPPPPTPYGINHAAQLSMDSPYDAAYAFTLALDAIDVLRHIRKEGSLSTAHPSKTVTLLLVALWDMGLLRRRIRTLNATRHDLVYELSVVGSVFLDLVDRQPLHMAVLEALQHPPGYRGRTRFISYSRRDRKLMYVRDFTAGDVLFALLAMSARVTLQKEYLTPAGERHSVFREALSVLQKSVSIIAGLTHLDRMGSQHVTGQGMHSAIQEGLV